MERSNLLYHWELIGSNTSLGARHPSYKLQRCMRNPATEPRKYVSYPEPRRASVWRSCHPLTGFGCTLLPCSLSGAKPPCLSWAGFGAGHKCNLDVFLAQPGPNCQSSFPSADSQLKCVNNLDPLSLEKAVQTMVNVSNSESTKNMCYGETQNSLLFL